MTINWGIIGCGDVTEVKSGPAFNKIDNSKLVAVMRRDVEKVKDYARRHQVDKWYTDAYELINDPEINAIYVATPPLQHEEYTIAALKAGKPVYVEKPMSVNTAAAQRMADAVGGSKLSVAHYRRAQPLFLKIKELVNTGAIGDIKFVDLKYLQPALTAEELQNPRIAWRVDPATAGGGLFHDLAPHQLDLMLYFFGEVKSCSGVSTNQQHKYNADDIVTGNILFENGVIFQGLWCFSAQKEEATDSCTIVASKGTIKFNVFDAPIIEMVRDGKHEKILFDRLAHVQQPMIEKVVQYFLGEGANPCSAKDGVEVMRIMETFTGK
jgi:predicted dehydrogenase